MPPEPTADLCASKSAPRNRLRGNFVRGLLGFAALTVLLLVFLHVYGLPSGLIRQAEAHLATRGIYLECDALRLHAGRQWSLDGLRWYLPDNRVTPCLQARELRLTLPLSDLLEGNWKPRRAELFGGVIHTDLGGLANDGGHSQKLHAERIHAELQLHDNSLQVQRIWAGLYGMDLHAAGFVLNLDELQGVARGASRENRAKRARILRSCADLVYELEQLRPEGLPRMDVEFTLDLADLEKSDFALKGDTHGPFTLRGLSFERLHLDGRYQARQWFLNELVADSALDEPGRLELSGQYDPERDEVHAQLKSSLPQSYYQHLMPDSMAQIMHDLDVAMEGHSLLEMEVGPASLAEAQRFFKLHAALEKVSLMGVFFPQLELHCEQRGNELLVPDFKGIVGRDLHQGPFEGSAAGHLTEKRYTIKLHGGFNPDAVLPLATEDYEEIIRRFEFSGSPPQTEIEIRRWLNVAGTKEIRVEALLNCSNLVYQGTQLESFSGGVTLSNRVLVIKDVIGRRGDDQEMSGSLRKDYEAGLVEVDIVSTLEPTAFARMLGTDAEQLLTPFRFRGPVRLDAKGVLDYRDFRRSDLKGSVEVERSGLPWLILDRCSMQWGMESNTLSFTQVAGIVNEGTFRGQGQLFDLDQSTNRSFSAEGFLANVDLAQLAKVVLDREQDSYSGRLSGHAKLSGRIGPGSLPALVGEGRVEIKKGELFRIPLLGGLSKYLSKIVKGFGYAAQSDFSSDFKIRNNAIHAGDLWLKGGLLSITARGDMNFNKKLSFKIQIKLLKDGLLAETVQLITWPVTKLMEFKLSGTLDQPEWRPDNLPKEIFGIF